MREPIELDIRGIWDTLQAMPQKKYGGMPRIYSNEEQWLIWLQHKRIPQKELARQLRSSTDRLAVEYKRMKEQGGPKGQRPEWMK